MVKSEYRREMIMLRPLEEGISGFCRLEAHVARGSMTYSVRTQRDFGGRLTAVLAGMRGGRWQAVAGGEIRMGSMGQAGFYWEIDPRSIGALALDNYALAGVAVDGPQARLLLAGRLDKSRMVDWDSAGRAVHDLLAPADAPPAAAQPDPPAPQPSGEDEVQPAADAAAVERAGAEPPPAPQPPAADQPQYDLSAFARCRLPDSAPSAPAPAAVFSVSCGEDDGLSDEQLEQLVEQTVRGMVESMESEQCAAHPAAPDIPDAAGHAPVQGGWMLEGICPPQRRWPDSCEQLRRLFMSGQRVYPIDAPGYVFVHAPMPDGGSCAVGVLCEDGRPSELMYLIPGTYSAQPPAGLEGYAWRTGAGGGYWMARQDAFTGSMLYGERGG